MREERKNIIERRILDLFQTACPFFPDGIIRKGVAGIEPDFIVENKCSRTGIELAGLNRDDGKDSFGVRPQAKFQERVIAEAKKRFESLTNKRFKVYVTFKERSGINNKDVTRLADYLSDKIIKVLNTSSPIYGYPITIGGSANLYPFDGVFSLIQVYHFENSSDFSWTRCNVNSVESSNKDVLSNLLVQKEQKYEKEIYSNCDSVWLLFYIDFFDRYMDQGIASFLNYPIKTSNFERILLYITHDKIYQLYTTRGENAV